MHRTYPTDDWQVNVAMDMTGQSSADFIKTGELIANNGVFELNMATGQVTMQNGDFTGKITSSNGVIGGFIIGADKLSRGDAQLSQYGFGCGAAGSGIALICGNDYDGSSDGRYGYVQMSNDGNMNTCVGGIRIYGNGHVVHYGANGQPDWDRWLSNVPIS